MTMTQQNQRKISVSPSIAARELLTRRRARESLVEFCKYVDRDYRAPKHIRLLADSLQQVEKYIATGGREGVGRLIVNMPPRHGKSETGSKRFPSFVLGRHQDWHIALVAYGDEIASDFSRANRSLCADNPDYRILFPDVIMHPASSAVQRWALKNGDADNPNVVATGMGGSLTGRGFQLIIIDDPVKNRAEAESKTYRDHLHDAYRGTIRTRLEPGGAIVIICTRWHEDDLPGWLLEQNKIGEGEKWEVLNLTAISEGEDDNTGRKSGDALWAKRFDSPSLLQTKAALGSYDWESQYMGRPKPPKGGKIQRSWFKIIDQLPPQFRSIDGSAPSETLSWYRYYDLAVTAKETSNWTASARVAFDSDGNMYIADMVRDKIEAPDQLKMIKRLMLSEKSINTQHGIEKAMQGASFVQLLLTDPDLRGVPFKGVDVDKDKLTRALPWIARAENGKVYLIAGSWVSAFLDECANFTGNNDKEDDQIDSISGGAAMAGLKPKVLQTTSNPFY